MSCFKLVKFVDFLITEDFGHDAYIIIGQFKNFNILDIVYRSSSYQFLEPNINLSFGFFDGNVVSFSIRAWNVGLSLSFLSYRCPLSMKWFRR
jgi:hypothetical protein